MVISKKCIFLAMLVVLTGYGCRLFEPRKPEEPDVSRAEWNLFPITPEQTLNNLEYAYNYQANADRYGSILTDDFRFFFDAQDVQDYNLPEYWGKVDEVAARKLINIDINIELTEIEGEDDVIQAQRATYNRDYQIRKKAGQQGTLFTGSLILDLRREDDGFWKIYRWEDYRNEDELDTWGRFKNEFAP